MPTSTGKPKVGETVQWWDRGRLVRTGTVTRRSAGTTWSLWVEWEGSLGHSSCLTQAQYWMDRGHLKLAATP